MSEVPLDEPVRDALQNGQEVTIELDEEYGWHVAIDGDRVTDEAFPWETLYYEVSIDED